MNKHKINVVRKLKELDTRADDYLDMLPSEFISLLCDNEYSNANGLKVDLLIEALFGEHYEDVTWFLYDFTAGRSAGPHIVVDEKEWTFKTDEDFYKYLETL